MRKISPEIVEYVRKTIKDREEHRMSDIIDYIEEEHHEIRPNLFLGSLPQNIDKFKYVFNFTGRPPYYIPLGKMVIVRPFNDCDQMPDTEMLHDSAQLVLKYSRLGPTLVHCTAGINRSSLVLALALIHDGYKPSEAIALIRTRRSKMCLSNQTFESWLLSLENADE